MKTVLKVIGGELEGQVFEIEQEELCIGRDAACEIQLPGEDVSRRHARLIRDENYYWIEDIDSQNGTVVNGTGAKRHCLRSGDVIEIGDHLLAYEAEGTGTERDVDASLREEAEALAHPEEEEAAGPRPYNIPAFAGLGLAVLGLPWLMGKWFALGAVVLGLVGLIQIVRSGRERGLSMAVMALLVGAMSAGWGFWQEDLRPRREVNALADAEQRAVRNLQRLYGAMRQYSLEHQDKLPESLADLHPRYIKDRAILSFPLAGDGQDSHYVLHLPGKPFLNKRDRMLVHSPRPHNGRWFVLHGDGFVEQVNQERFEELRGS